MSTTSTSTPTKPTRARAIAASAAATAAIALSLFGMAAPANAAISSPGANTAYATGSTVAVSGTAPSGATLYAIAACDTSVPAAIGTKCNHDSSANYTALLATSSGATFSSSVVVKRTFTNFDYTTHSTTSTTTTCKNASGAGTQCGLVVSYYTGTASAPVPLTSEYVNIRVN